MAGHDFAKEMPMLNLLGGEALGIAEMRGLAQEVVGAAHVDFALELHVEESDVDGGASGVARLVG